MKYILGLQTAEYPNNVALLNEHGELIRQKKLDAKEQTVERLGSLVKEITKGIVNENLLLVAVCLGPGSYTGLRAGLAFAKGFCQFTKISLVGVSAFEALQASLPGKEEINVLFDAKNERVFFQKKDKLYVDDLSAALRTVVSKSVFAGSGAVAYKDQIAKSLGLKTGSLKILSDELFSVGVAKAAVKAYRENPSMYSKEYLYNIKPLYILPPNITYNSNVPARGWLACRSA
ncbi:MAG: tRNA (adenosine(37)-N6)-threonylcarbamoyltransferase complex dimerization subunit type 1 TsaB [Patescibacteria group bacterium]|nr:tRNA (adenosine(37)-N6)-threonylcarbamoyltransferase complex dimerization subunit type 1 TsaB [Patescibacteria group bacterium]